MLKKGKAGMALAKLRCKHGISNATYYIWKNKYLDVRVSELRRLQELEEENQQPKRMCAGSGSVLRGCGSTIKSNKKNGVRSRYTWDDFDRLIQYEDDGVQVYFY